jgi:hypothetical protein
MPLPRTLILRKPEQGNILTEAKIPILISLFSDTMVVELYLSSSTSGDIFTKIA